MKLAFSTNAFTRFPLIEAMERIARAGFPGVEILADAPHAYPEAIDAKLTSQVAAALQKNNLAVSNVNCNCTFGYWKDAPPEAYFEPSIISPNLKHRADRIRLIEKILVFARDIGAKNVSITSGRMIGGMPPDRAAIQFRESILPLLDQADRLNIDLGIELEPGLFLEYVEELKHWIEELKHPRLGANLDIGHCQVIGESISDAVRILQGKIWNLHVEDIPGRKHYHMIPGQGTVDWAALVQALRETNYRRFATVELYTHTESPDEAAIKSFEFLSRYFPA
jgi:sugar phosphate isomerase/epimerase